MCVIMIAEQKRPTEEMIRKGFETNPAGAGIAWREEHTEKGIVVKWVKGINLQSIQDLVKTVPLPFVVHFRIPTVGGPLKELCHPFPIHIQTPNHLKGSTTGYVLFHNGHWTRWKETLLESSVAANGKLPVGKWSDSRAMAWVAARHGHGILELIDEKAVAFGPKHLEIFGSGWDEVESCYVSNKYWIWEGRNANPQGHRFLTPPVSIMGPSKQVTAGKTGGSSQDPSFRRSTETFCSGEIVEKETQESAEGVRQASKGSETAGEEGNDRNAGSKNDPRPLIGFQSEGFVPAGQADIYVKLTGHDRDVTQKLIDDILSGRDQPYDPKSGGPNDNPADQRNEAERIYQPTQEEIELRAWACAINNDLKRSEGIDTRLEEISKRNARLMEHRRGIIRVGPM